MTQIHATCVEVEGIGVLLRGPSGSGKSDLALRLIDGGARLVADDRTDLAVEDGRLIATCPAALAGRMEVRGVGIGPVPSAARAVVGLVIDLVEPARVERLPAPTQCRIDGIAQPCLALAPFEASAPAKLRLAARWVQCGILPSR
jgi:serine kinase of HPr protein (carbohydrate metabolism regulator)